MAVVAQKTPCLILDEPTNHLDITYQLELLDIVKSLNMTDFMFCVTDRFCPAERRKKYSRHR